MCWPTTPRPTTTSPPTTTTRGGFAASVGSSRGTANTGNGWNLCRSALHAGRAVYGGYHRLSLHRPAVRLVHDQPGCARSPGALHHQRRTTWTPVGPIQVSGGGSAFNNQITIDFNALGITSVENNPGFGVQMVSVFDPDYQGRLGYSSRRAVTSALRAATGTYTAASLDQQQPAGSCTTTTPATGASTKSISSVQPATRIRSPATPLSTQPVW